MDTIQKIFIAWVVLCVIILLLAIVSLVISMNNSRRIKKLENSSS